MYEVCLWPRYSVSWVSVDIYRGTDTTMLGGKYTDINASASGQSTFYSQLLGARSPVLLSRDNASSSKTRITQCNKKHTTQHGQRSAHPAPNPSQTSHFLPSSHLAMRCRSRPSCSSVSASVSSSTPSPAFPPCPSFRPNANTAHPITIIPGGRCSPIFPRALSTSSSVDTSTL